MMSAAHFQASPKKGRGRSLSTCAFENACISIAAEIQPCSVRAVAYRLFTLGLLPEMSKNSTNKVSLVLTRLRELGEIPWNQIVDDGRQAQRVTTWDNPAEIIDAAVRSYRRDAWREQRKRVEIIVEKGTIRSTLAPVLDEFGVTCRVMRGYGSATAINDLAQEIQADARPLVLLCLGDHDPSGRHMSDADLPARLHRYGGAARIVRLAITATDVIDAQRIGLATFSADTKTADARHNWFVERFGQRCIELDAMSPPMLRERVHKAVSELIEPEAWAHSLKIQAAEIESMQAFHRVAKDVLRSGVAP